MKHQPRQRIGLLLCDDVDEHARARYGTYARMFHAGLRAGGGEYEMTNFDCYRGDFPHSARACDAYLISGSRSSAYEKTEWIETLRGFVRACADARVKTVGICFGHQLIAHALGGEAQKAGDGWGAGIHASRVVESAGWMRSGGESNSDCATYNLVVLHQDQVTSLPPNSRILAENDFCPVSMFATEDVALGIQGHPEFDKEFCAFRVNARREIFGPKLHRESLDSLRTMQLDSKRVWRWVTKFLRA